MKRIKNYSALVPCVTQNSSFHIRWSCKSNFCLLLHPWALCQLFLQDIREELENMYT